MSRLRRICGVGGKIFHGLVVALVIVVAVTLLGVNLPIARRTIAREVTSLLDGVLTGKIVIDEIGWIRLDGVSGVRARVLDAEGKPVIQASGVSGEIRTLSLVYSLIKGNGLVVHLTRASIDHVDALFDADADGELRLVQAVTPPPSKEPEPSAETPSPPLRFRIDSARIGTAWVHGRPFDEFDVDADLAGAEARLTVSGAHVIVDVHSAGIVTRALPDGADAKGTVKGQIDIRPAPAALETGGTFDGTIGGARATVRGILDGGRLTAHVDAEAPPEAVARLVPGVRPRAATRATVDASGDLPALSAVAAVRSGTAVIDVTATGAIGKTPRASADVTAEHVDLEALFDGAPASDLNAKVHAAATFRPGGKIAGTFRLETRPAKLEKLPIPRVAGSGDFTESGASGRFDVAEPGAPAHVAASIRFAGRNPAVDFDATVSVPDLRKIRRLGSLGEGRAEVAARGSLDLRRPGIRADVSATVTDVAEGPVALRSGQVAGTLAGALGDPHIEATVIGKGVTLAGRPFDDAKIDLQGGPRQASFAAVLHGQGDNPDLNATGKLEIGDSLSIRNAQVEIGKGDTQLQALARSLRFGGGGVQAEGVTIEGAGAPFNFDARFAHGAADVRASTTGFDVGVVAKALGLADRRIQGKVALDVDLKARGSTAKGKVDVELKDGAYDDVSGIGLRVATTVNGRRFTGNAEVTLAGGHVAVAAENLLLDGSPLALRAWERATGHATVESEIDVGRLSKVLPRAVLPFDDMDGTVAVSGEFTRAPGDGSPATSWTVHTDDFTASGKSEAEKLHDGTTVRAPPAWHVAGIDVDGTVSIAKEFGRTKIDLSLRDKLGRLVALDGTADVPYGEFLAEPASVRQRGPDVPFELHVVVPRRRLSKLPPILAVSGLDGDVELHLEARDTLRAPRMSVEGDAHHVVANGHRKGDGVDVRLDGEYAGDAGKLSVRLDRKRSTALALSTEVRAKVADFIDPKGGPASWDANVTAKVSKFPLDLTRLVGSRRINGTVSGELDAALGTNVAPRLHAKLDVDALGVGRSASGRAAISVDADEQHLAAKVRFDEKGGFAEASATAGLAWKTPLAPAIDPNQRVEAHVQAKAFRVGILSPFVQSAVRDLDGKVDANARFEVLGEHGTPRVDGAVVVDDASFELTGPGQEFHDVHASITARPDGTLRVEEIEAHGLTGTLKANGEASFDGIHLRKARIEATIPKHDPFPVTIEGQSFARAHGDLTIEAAPSPDKRAFDLTLHVPKATVELLPKSTHELQGLDHDEHVRVGYHRTTKEFVVVPLERPRRDDSGGEPPTLFRAKLKLDDVEVSRGSDLRARLEGEPTIEIGDQTNISGQIRLRSGGLLYVQGKRFEIESGTITFTGEPDNPDVTVTAGWTAPEGTRVYADFVGPLKTGKVTLRSEPSRTKNEILSLILFGTTDGGGAGSSPSAAGTGIGVAGGVVTQGLNRALDDLTGLDITTRIDTSEASNPRPELEVRVARDVTVAVSHVIGVPTPGTNPDLNFATVDWRFLRNWSLSTTVGDQGSSILDVVWQYRY